MRKIGLFLLIFILMLSFNIKNVYAEDKIIKDCLIELNSSVPLEIDGYTITESNLDRTKTGLYSITYKDKESKLYTRQVIVIPKVTKDDLNNVFETKTSLINTEYEILNSCKCFGGIVYLLQVNRYDNMLCLVKEDSVIFSDIFNYFTHPQNSTCMYYESQNDLLLVGGEREIVSFGHNIFYVSFNSNLELTYKQIRLSEKNQFVYNMYKNDKSYYFLCGLDGAAVGLIYETDDFDIVVIKTDSDYTRYEILPLTQEGVDNYIGSCIYNNKIVVLKSYNDNNNYELSLVNSDLSYKNVDIDFDNTYQYFDVLYRNNLIHIIGSNSNNLKVFTFDDSLNLISNNTYDIKNITNFITLDNSDYFYIGYEDINTSNLNIININNDSYTIINTLYSLSNKKLINTRDSFHVQNGLSIDEILFHDIKVDNNILNIDEESTLNPSNINTDNIKLEYGLYEVYVKFDLFDYELYYTDLYLTDILTDIANYNVYSKGYKPTSNSKIYVNDLEVDSNYIFNEIGDYKITLKGNNVDDLTYRIEIKDLSYNLVDNLYDTNINYTITNTSKDISKISINNIQTIENLNQENYNSKLWYLMIPVASTSLSGILLFMVGKKKI